MPVCSIQAAPFAAFFLPPHAGALDVNLPDGPHLPAAALFSRFHAFGRLTSIMCAAFFSLGFTAAECFAIAPTLMEKNRAPEYEYSQPALPETPEAAQEALSGSRFPGCVDHLLARPLPNENAGSLRVHINYPSTGYRKIDADIREWVSSLADAFAGRVSLEEAMKAADNTDFSLDRFLDDNDLILPDQNEDPSFELWGDYSVSFPSANAVSVTFEIWNYNGSGQNNLDVLTLNYSKITNQRLELVDMFENPQLALELMSNFSRKRLGRENASRSRMLLDGTEPLPENFSSLTLTDAGICINFQPYQVAPGEAGAQKLEMPLEELLPAGPLLALWNK